MPEGEHRISIPAASCGEEDCTNCSGNESYIEGTIEEVVRAVYDLGFERDEFLMEHIIVHQSNIMALLGRVEALEGATSRARNGIDFGFGAPGKMN